VGSGGTGAGLGWMMVLGLGREVTRMRCCAFYRDCLQVCLWRLARHGAGWVLAWVLPHWVLLPQLATCHLMASRRHGLQVQQQSSACSARPCPAAQPLPACLPACLLRRESPSRRLTLAMARELVPGDVLGLQRVWHFLDHQGLINFQARDNPDNDPEVAKRVRGVVVVVGCSQHVAACSQLVRPCARRCACMAASRLWSIPAGANLQIIPRAMTSLICSNQHQHSHTCWPALLHPYRSPTLTTSPSSARASRPPRPGRSSTSSCPQWRRAQQLPRTAAHTSTSRSATTQPAAAARSSLCPRPSSTATPCRGWTAASCATTAPGSRT
jgi:hypothetical protein